MKDMMKSVSSWTVKLLAAAGVCLGLGLQTADANWGDKCYWKDNASSANWNSDSWYNSTQGWDNHNPNYEGGRELHFDNNNNAGSMTNDFTGVGQKQYRLIFDATATSQRIIRGSTWNTNWDNGGQMPKVENYATVEHRVLYPIAIGNANGMEMNPINGDLTMTNVAAMGHALNVFGSNGKTLKIANFYAGTNTAASAPSTVYVDSTSTVMIKSWRGASSKVQTANVNAAGGLLVVSNLDGKAVWIKSGAGTMRVETSSGASNLNLTVSAGRLELAPTTSTTSLTNLWVTNSATVVLHKPVSLRRVTLNPNCVVEMDVLGNQSVASLGVLPESVDSSHQFVCASGNKHTLKLKYTSGFDPTQDAEWVVYVGRKKSASGGSMTSAETSQMTLDTSDLAAHGATGTFSDPTLCANSSGAPNTAIKVTYTAPSAPQAAVGLATTTFTYAGSGITLTPTGGSGTGAYSLALASGGTGTGSLSGTTLTVTKCGTFKIDVTRAAGGGYAARTDRVTVTVNKGTQTISGLGNVTKTYGDAAFALAGTAIGAVTYSSGNPGVATVTSGGTVTIVAAGSATITATAAATDLYAQATKTITLTVNAAVPTVGAVSQVALTPNSMTVEATATSAGGTALTGGGFQYGTTTGYGSTAALSGAPTEGTAFQSTLTGLSPATAYHVRGYAQNSAGNGYGADSTLWTMASEPGAPTAGVVSNLSSGARIQWTAPATAPDGYLIFRVAGTTATTFVPEDGTEYTKGETYDGATLVYVAAGSATTYNNTGATADKLYTFSVYAFNVAQDDGSAVAGTYNYNATPATGTGAKQAASAPAAAPTLGTISSKSRSATIPWTWTGTAGQFVMVMVSARSSLSTPGDGATYEGSASFGAGDMLRSTAAYGYVVYVGASGDGSGSVTVTGLSPETTYYVRLAAGNGANSPKYTSGTVSTFTTSAAGSAPVAQATGVDGSEYTLEWSPVSSGNGTYAVQMRPSGSSFDEPGSETVMLENGFTAADGWTANETTATGTLTVDDGTWSISGCKVRSATTLDNDLGYIYVSAAGNYLQTPPLYGDIGEAEIVWRSAGGARTNRVSYSVDGGSTWQTLRDFVITAANTQQTNHFLLPAPQGALADGIRLRFTTMQQTIYILSLKVKGHAGHSRTFTGLTSGSTYASQVKVDGGDDWSDPVSVVAGVVPGSLAAGAATRSSVAFGWNAASGASGYRVDATTDEWAGVTNECGTGLSTYATEPASDAAWCYVGTTESGLSGSISTVPSHNASYGHFLAGAPGNALVSPGVALKGSQDATLMFSVGAWNLGQASQDGLEAGRVSVSYSLSTNGGSTYGAWNYIGSATPAATNDGSLAACTFALPKGAYDNANAKVRFKIAAPFANKIGNYARGPYVSAVKVLVAGGADFSQSLAGYPKAVSGTSETVTGLPAETKVHFRVQALQGASVRSVWVEATGETESHGGPTGVTAEGMGRYEMAVSWDAAADAGATYNVELTSCSSAGGESAVATCANSSLSFGSSSSAWTYQRGVSGNGTQSSYPQWSSTYMHMLVGSYGSMGTRPGLESPTVDLSGYESATVEFSHRYFNKSASSPVTVYYKVGSGSWTAAGTTAAAPGYSAAGAVTRRVDLPAAALAADAKVKLVAASAAAYSSVGADGTTNWYAAGALVSNVTLRAVAPGGGDFTCATTVRASESGTSHVFTGLDASTLYYVRVQTVLTGSQSQWSEASARTRDPMAAPTVGTENIGKYAATVTWAAPAGESANVTGWKVQLTKCLGSSEGEPQTNSCPDVELATSESADDWSYVNRTGGYPSRQTWGGYNGGAHFLVGTTAGTATPKGIASPLLDLAGMGSAYVEFMHAPNLQNPVSRSYISLYYKVGNGAWTLGSTLQDAGQVYPSLVFKKLRIAVPSAALQSNVRIRLMADSAYKTDDGETVHQYGARLANIKLVAVPQSTGADWETAGCVQTYNASANETSHQFSGLDCGTDYGYRVIAYDEHTPNGNPSAEGAGTLTTLSGEIPPASIWAENVKQTSFRLEWDAQEAATDATRYKVEVSACAGAAWERQALAQSATNAHLVDGDDWQYVGGGDEIPQEQTAYITGRGLYPAWAGGNERSQVLAGEGEPGLESVEFSTVGATAAAVTFGHGRWYNATDLSLSAVTLSYSIDGGSSWVEWQTTPTADVTEYATRMRNYPLPAAALGQSRVQVRLVAKSAGYLNGKPAGAAIRSATVVLSGEGGDFTTGGCVVASAEGLTECQLPVTGLSADTAYYFRVAASDGETVPLQYGAWTEGAARTLEIPGAPMTPWAEDIGTRTFMVAWNAVSGAETYNVKVYAAGQESTPIFTANGVEATFVAATGLSPDTVYYFKVQSAAAGSTSAWSDAGNAQTLDGVHVTGLHAENESLTGMDVVWNAEGGLTYTLSYGPAEGTGAIAETLSCPNTTLSRTDSGNEWCYIGGNASWPAYYVGSAAADKGHGLIYTAGGNPGLQSRWFSTRGAGRVTVEFLHGRFNATANSAVTLTYSIDEGKTWTLAGRTGTSTSSTPSDEVSMELPERALGQKSVMVRLTAEDANNSLGAHVNDVKIRIWSASNGTTVSGRSVSGGRAALTGLESGTRYWFSVTGTDSGESDTATASGATHEAPATAWKSQGFDGYDGAQALAYTIKYLNLSDGSVATANLPEVTVVDGENPLYGHKALRMSGSASATVYGVAEFDVGAINGRNGVLTVPFSAKDLARNDYLYFCYSIDGGSTWQAPTTNATAGGMRMMRIGIGGSDVLNQNWTYNRGTNSTTRPHGDAFTWAFPDEVTAASTLKFRIAFCGQTGGANHYYYIDNVTLAANAGTPAPVMATANDDGSIALTWTPPSGQDVIIIRGQDQRFAPPSPIDLNNLPEGYSVVLNGTDALWPEATTSTTDTGVWGGYRYFYYFYAVLDGQIGLTPAVAWVNPKGMVQAIASQGWDGWDVHPWSYELGRVTHPTWYSDYGWWINVGHYGKYDNVEFIANSWDTSSDYATYYADGLGSTNQIDISAYTNYYGTYSLRISGGGGTVYNRDNIVWTNQWGGVETNSRPYIGTNNAAIQFANVDLSGYRNVQFQMHYAGALSGGGNYLHIAISTNGGAPGTWQPIDNQNEAGWRVLSKPKQDYGLQVQDMRGTQTDTQVDFYSQELAQYGNPFVLQVPDSVTQFMARVMFYDSNGRSSWRNAAYFIDEVRLTGEPVLETPHPVMTEISSNAFTASWGAIAGATDYTVQVTECEDANRVKAQESFVLSVLTNGWTKSGTGTSLISGANRTGTGYTLNLTGNGGWAESPEIGAARVLSFWAKASGASGTCKLVLEAKATDATEWETVGEYDLAALGTAYRQYNLALPHRQWQSVRFRRESSGSASNIHIDDVVILGGGDYSTSGCVTYSQNVGSATNVTITGCDASTEYFVEVQAHGTAGGGVDVYSSWGETADYTTGTAEFWADGFEMVRMAWEASASMPILIATAADDGTIGTPNGAVAYAAGDTLPGGGTVLLTSTATVAHNANFEHVVPFNAGVKYAAFWKRGNYYEGRFETNFWMRRYSSTAADATAVTNATAGSGLADVTEGKGWDGGWSVWDDGAGYIGVFRESSTSLTGAYGLLGSNKLYGAGGNMVRFTMTADSRKLRARRMLAEPMTSGKAWIMVTLRSQYGGDSADKMYGFQLMSGRNSADIFASLGKGKYLYGGNPRIQIDTSKDGSGFPAGTAIAWGSNYDLADSGHGNAGPHTLVACYDLDTGALKLTAFYTPDTTFPVDMPEPTSWQCTTTISGKPQLAGILLMGYGYNGNLDFDEVRIGPTWESLIGGGMTPPNPVSVFTATPDGNELVRLDWALPGGSTNVVDDVTVVTPPAAGVVILDSATAFTGAEELIEGKTYRLGETVGSAKVAYAGGGTTADHVVEPGSMHFYRAFAYSGSMVYTNGFNATTEYPAVMGTYGAREFVNPFSYTNGTWNSTTDATDTWRGGNGFLDAGATAPHYWSVVNGHYDMKLPEWRPGYEQTMPHFHDVTGYPARKGNLVMARAPGNNGYVKMRRDLGRVVSAADTNFYIAFMMAYEYEGPNKWAGLSLLDSDGVEKAFFGKGHGADYSTLNVGDGNGNKAWGNSFHGYNGALDYTYLVIGKYNFAENTLSVKAFLTTAANATLPSTGEPQWEATLKPAGGIQGIKKIELTAGSTDPNGTIGCVWYDEIRWATSWEELVSGVCPEGIDGAWFSHEGATVTSTYLGNTEDLLMRSHPSGFGQLAKVGITWGTGSNEYDLAWMMNESGTPTYSWWSNRVQAVQVGQIGGDAPTIPSLAWMTAMNDETCYVSRNLHPLEILPLTPPNPVSAAMNALRTNSAIDLAWTRWTDTAGIDGKTRDVLVVRFAGASQAEAEAAAAAAANQPVPGRAYYAGDSIGAGTVVYRGSAETYTAGGLQPDTWYAFAFFSENWSYYSAAALASAKTADGGHQIDVDGDPSDWYGEPPETVDTGHVSLSEYIWLDKTEEARRSGANGEYTHSSEDIHEFRIYADADWVYFLVKMKDITNTNSPYVAIGIDDRRNASSTGPNWLGDEANTFIGGNYWGSSAAEHYPHRQLAIHNITGEEGTRIEQWNADSTTWAAPTGEAPIDVNGTPTVKGSKAAIGEAVELRIARSDLALDGLADGAVVTQRFTVATFLNSGIWNNQGQGTAELDAGTSRAVDALGIAPQKPSSKPDNDYKLSSWDEDLSDGNVDFWIDVRFDNKGIIANAKPERPALAGPADGAELSASPTFTWASSTDSDGDVTGYMLEVSTNADFNDLNGAVTLRVNVEAGKTSYSGWTSAKADTLYYWRVRARDNSGELSTAEPRSFYVSQDGHGPVATLKYVGSDVAGYLAGDYEQQEAMYPETLTMVTDHDIAMAASGAKFGFVLQWDDPSGVYATNKFNASVPAGTGRAGEWSWNILSEWGRVSPNWDLVEMHTDLTDDTKTASQLREMFPDYSYGTGAGWSWYVELGCWGYEWGYDEAFTNGCAAGSPAGTIGHNGGEVVTNYNAAAFETHGYNSNVVYYLTVSAEDCTTWKESQAGYWEYGTWRSYTGNDRGKYTSGYCEDGPSYARNVTTNQLLRIDVRDQDTVPPGASTARWGTYSMVITSNSTTDVNFANPALALPLEQGAGELPVYSVTDGQIAGLPLAIHFNVYDSYITGIQAGTDPSVELNGHIVTNTSFLGTESGRNWTNYSAARSVLSNNGMADTSVLTWFWETLTPGLMSDFCGTNADWEATTNAISLDLYDSDNDRAEDQEHKEHPFGYLAVRDDDTDDPEISALTVTGTGIGAALDVLATWELPRNSNLDGAPNTAEYAGLTCTAASGVHAAPGSVASAAAISGGTSGLGGTTDGGGVFPSQSSAWAPTGENALRGVQFSLATSDGEMYKLAEISFDAQIKGSYPWRGPQVWELYASDDNYATPLCSGTFDLGEDGVDNTNDVPAAAWTTYTGSMGRSLITGNATFRLMVRRTVAPELNTGSPNFYIKNVSLTGSLQDSRYADVVTDGDLAHGTAVYHITAKDATSGLLTTGLYYTAAADGTVVETVGGPRVSFWRNETGATPVTNALLALTGSPADGVARGSIAAALAGTAPAAAKTSIEANASKSSPFQYRASATVHDFDNDRVWDSRGATRVETGVPVYDDDLKAPTRGVAMQGGPLGVKTATNAAGYVTSIGGGNRREYRVSDADLETLESLVVGTSFYDYSGWALPTLSLTKAIGGETNSMSVASLLTAAGTFDGPSTAEKLDAAAWWNVNLAQASADLTAATVAGDFKVTYGITAASVSDLDDDRTDANGVNIDSLTATDLSLGSVTFLDNDTGLPNVQRRWNSGYGESGGWRIPQVLTGSVASAVGDARISTLPDTSQDVDLSALTSRVYDGRLAAGDGVFVYLPAYDYSGGYAGQSAQGVLFGTTTLNTELAHVRTNSWLSIGSLVTRDRAHYRADLSSPLAQTKSAMLFPTSVWAWTSFDTNTIGRWLPSGTSVEYELKAGLYDADGNRDGDQCFREVALGWLEVRDDDTSAPTAPGDISVNGQPAVTGELTRETAPWTNALSTVVLTFEAAEDGEMNEGDIEVSGIAGYRRSTSVPQEATDGTELVTTTNTVSGKQIVRADLGESSVTAADQGLLTNYVFAVDADADRPGDQLAGAAKSFAIAYDITPPTAVSGLEASTESVEDPTTQFALSWSTTGVGPDDPTSLNYQSSWSGSDVLSPWSTYKVYYGMYDAVEAEAHEGYPSSEAYIYSEFILGQDYRDWSNVVSTSIVEDPSAGAATYATLASSSTAAATLYDLDYDRDYVVVIVGVDKAGNEGPANEYSWATNNTIKFAVTQGVMRARSFVTNAFGTNHNMRVDDRQTAAIYWLAASNSIGEVRRDYDLIYWDSVSFRESTNNTWSLVSTVRSNWFTDALALDHPQSTIRFYRASYKDRWRRDVVVTNAGGEVSVRTQRPLMSEDVYAMTSVPLVEGANFVSLHGYAYTNTLAGIFGSDTNIWPSGEDATEATRIEVYGRGAYSMEVSTRVPSMTYWFGIDGHWYDPAGEDVSDTVDTNLFIRGFSIVLPDMQTRTNMVEFTQPYGTETKGGFHWHPILRVPTNNVIGAEAEAGFSIPIKAGSPRAGAIYNLCGFPLPAAMHPARLNLLESGFHGAGTLGFADLTCDILYAFDTQTKSVRHSSGVYYDTVGQKWRFIEGDHRALGNDERPFCVNDMLVIVSRGGQDWVWTLEPSMFYDAPTRWAGW